MLSPRGGRDLPKVTWEPGAEPAPSSPLWALAFAALAAAKLGTCGWVGSGSLACQEQISRIQGDEGELGRAPLA